MSAKSISVYATVLLIAAVLALVIRRSLLATGLISGSLQIAGLALVIWARLTFGMRSFHFAANPTKGALITGGPYHYIRNPIYSAIWLVSWTGVGVHWSVGNAALGIVIAVTLIIKIVCEERLLRAAYPEYENYAHDTSRLVPFLL